MSGPWSWQVGVRARELIAFGALSALACAAPAQTLDIRPTSQPAGAGASVRAARDALAEDLGRIEAPGADAGAQARRALRQCAIGLLGDDAAPEMALLGRTLWRLMDELDAQLESASAAEARHVAEALQAAPVPETIREAETLLRDALAPLAQRTAGEIGGWIDSAPDARPGGALAAPLDRAFLEGLVSAGLDQEIADRLGAMEADLLAEADQWRAYRRSSAAIRADVRRAAPALGVALPWVEEVAGAALSDAVSDAALRLMEPEEDPAGALAALAGASRAAELLEALDAAGGRGWAEARAAGQGAVARDPVMGAAQLREAGALAISLSALARASSARSEREVVRQLRPAWRWLAAQQEEAGAALGPVAADLLSSRRTVTDPAVLAAADAMIRLGGDLAALRATSAVLADPATPEGREPVAAREHRLVAARLLSLGQAVQDGEDVERALTELRQFTSILRARANGPTLQWVDARQAPVQRAWREMAGARALELLETDARVLETWLAVWPETNDATRLRELEQRLRAHELLFDLLVDLAEVRALSDPDPGASGAPGAPGASAGLASRWPGWELSAPALRTLVDQSDAQMAEAVRLALDRRGEAPAQRALALQRELAPLRLVAALERRLTAAGAPGHPGPLDEIALGAALPHSLLADRRAQLAGAALALEDWALDPGDADLHDRAVRLAEGAVRAIGR
ncbi:MAG: hypothetical protein ACF8R7_17080 [Phycisphaerales bacterium JB039]